jgi:hypothetical protein
MSKDERNEKFSEIKNGLQKQKDEELNDFKNFGEKIKNMVPNKKNKEFIKKETEKRKQEIENLDKLILLIKSKETDQWTPAPLFSKAHKNHNVEITNKDIPEYIIQVHLGKTDYKKANMYLEAAFKSTEEDIQVEHNIVLKDKKNYIFDKTINFKLDKSGWRSGFRKQIMFDIYINYIL